MAKVLSLVFDTPDLDVLVKSGDKQGSMKRLANYLNQLASGGNAGTNTLTAIENGVRATGTITFAATPATGTVTFAATQATGTITLSSALNNNDYVDIISTATVYRFTGKTANPSGENEFLCGVSASADAQALKAKINASTTVGALVQASGGAAELTITSVNVLSSTHLVNGYGLAESTATVRMTVSGATLSGGTNIAENETVSINGKAFTAKNSGAVLLSEQFNIGTGAPATANATTATNFAAAVNGSDDVLISGLFSATSAAGVVTISTSILAVAATMNGYALTDSAAATTTSGSFSGGTTPAATETITVNGVPFTARASGATGDEFNIGTGATAAIANALTATNFAAALNASASDGVENTVTASSSAGVVTLTADDPGVGGNAIDLAETCAATTKSGTALSGGTDGTRITFTF